MATTVIGWDAIERQYNLYKDYPYYGLFDAKKNSDLPGNMIFPYKGGDKKEGWEVLRENLLAAEQNSPEAPFIIQFYEQLSKSDRLDKNTPASGFFKFSLKPYEGYKPAINGVPAGNDFNQYLRFQLDEAKVRIRELEQDKEDLEDEIESYKVKDDGKEIGGVIGQIGDVTNKYPVLAEIAKDLMTMFKHSFIKPHTQPAAAAGGIGSVTTEAPADLGTAQKILLSWYAKEYGGGSDTEEGRRKGAEMFVKDMCLLAKLTIDDDMMRLALKKLRALE